MTTVTDVQRASTAHFVHDSVSEGKNVLGMEDARGKQGFAIVSWDGPVPTVLLQLYVPVTTSVEERTADNVCRVFANVKLRMLVIGVNSVQKACTDQTAKKHVPERKVAQDTVDAVLNPKGAYALKDGLVITA